MTQPLMNIIILSLVLKTNKLLTDKEIRIQNVRATAIWSQSYPNLVKQLLHAFYGIVTSIDVSDPYGYLLLSLIS